MAIDQLVTPEVAACVGRESTRRDAIEDVTTSEVRRSVLATLDDNPLWHDKDYANNTRFGSGCAPAHFPMRAVAQFRQPLGVRDLVRELDFEDDYRADDNDRREDGDHSVLIDWPAGIGTYHAGNEVEYFQFPRIGDRLSMVEKIIRIEEKVGKSGKLAVIYIDQTYTNERGEVLLINHGTRIAREMPDEQWSTRSPNA